MKARFIFYSETDAYSVVILNGNKLLFNLADGIVSRGHAINMVNEFNSALSAHVAKETEQLQAEIDRLKKEVKKFEKENDRLRVAYKSLERKLNVASESLKEANEFLNDPKKLGEYIAGM